MKKQKYFLLFSVLLVLVSCAEEKIYTPISGQTNTVNRIHRLTEDEKKDWYLKDIELDSIPGISLQRAYDSLLVNKKGKKIIVAVIDMAIEINHDSLKRYIWVNQKEVANNNIDDDQNGYVDDVHGWNFLSHKSGENNEFVNYEYTRILRKYNKIFKGKSIENIDSKDSLAFIIYQRAKIKHEKKSAFAKKDLNYISNISKYKKGAEKKLETYFKDGKYSLKDLDSLKKVFPNNKKLQSAILRKSNFERYGFTDAYLQDSKLKAEQRIAKLLNLSYNDRVIHRELGDNLQIGSGNFKVNTSLLSHGTLMAGIISRVGIKDEIKIMPLAVSAYGDEHDKDIASAIRYAVDHGAKVINMSFAKEFSLHYELVSKAIMYAERNNVVLIVGASNENENVDDESITWFPNDHNYFDVKEISNNLIKVGSSGYEMSSKLKSSYSNYGKREVDVFAPGEHIFTTFPKNKLDVSYGGTSNSTALVSGVAALVKSYYPSLTAVQLKKVLLESGVSYEIDVNIGDRKKKKLVPFSTLSKSGKIVNAYNALLMAEKISKTK
jgi:subtilisin family serine protease